MIKGMKRKYQDFNSRMCSIRETFEEINQLIVKPINGGASSHYIVPKGMRELYVQK
jgi:hypothetical protein